MLDADPLDPSTPKTNNAMNKDNNTRDLPPLLQPSILPTFRITLPDATGNAIGMDEKADAGGVAITAAPNANAKLARYGIAYAASNGVADAAASGAAVAHHGGTANSGDGGVSYAWSGTATTYRWGTAYAIAGKAWVHDDGVAVVLLNGSATVAEGGVACALNFKRQEPILVTDPTAGNVSGGKGSVVVAFTSEKPTGTPRRPVVGLIGERPDFLDLLPDLEARLLAAGVQFGLKAGMTYVLNPATGKLEEIP